MYVLTGGGDRFGLAATSQEQLLEGSSSVRPYIYNGFFRQTPERRNRSEEGPWLRFDATVLRPDGSANMNCVQFSKFAPTSKWILFDSLCVKEGKASTNAADLVLQSLQANTEFAKYEDDQRKIEEEKKKVDAARNKFYHLAEEEAKVRPVAPTAATSAPAPVAAAAPAVGAASVTYSGSMYCSAGGGPITVFRAT